MHKYMIALPEHVFWPDDMVVAVSGPFASLPFVGHRETTDAYLLALAQQQQQQSRLVTLDRGIGELVAQPHDRARWIELIDPGE